MSANLFLYGGIVEAEHFPAGIVHASSAKAAATRLVHRRILQETPEGLKFSNPFLPQPAPPRALLISRPHAT